MDEPVKVTEQNKLDSYGALFMQSTTSFVSGGVGVVFYGIMCASEILFKVIKHLQGGKA